MKKAISPLIAVILLVVFSVAVSTAILSWLTDYTKTTTEAASSGIIGTGGVVDCANQLISIDTVSIVQDTDTVTKLNDSFTSKTYSSATGDTFPAYIRILKNATVTSTELTITGQAI